MWYPSFLAVRPGIILLVLVLTLATSAQAQAPPPGSPAGGYPDGSVVIDTGGLIPFNFGNYLAQYANGTNSTVTYFLDPRVDTAVGTIPSSVAGLLAPERTLRYNPGGFNWSYCFIGLSKGIWSVRLGFAYYNYDGKGVYPFFKVSLGEVNAKPLVVDHINLKDWETGDSGVNSAPDGAGPGRAHYTEYVTPVAGDTLLIEFRSVDNATSPIVNIIELVPYGADAFPTINAMYVPEGVPWALSLKHRLKLGGTGVAEDDRARRWHAAEPGMLVELTQGDVITGATQMPQYSNMTKPIDASTRFISFLPSDSDPILPQSLFESAVVGGNISDGSQLLGVRMVYRPVAPLNRLMARLFVIELDPAVRVGQRVFNITFASSKDGSVDPNACTATHWDPPSVSYLFDIFASTHAQSAAQPELLVATYLTQVGCHPLLGDLLPSGMASLDLLLHGAATSLPPLLSGLELFELVADDPQVKVCSAHDLVSSSSCSLPPSGRMSTWAIVGIVLASVAGAVVIIAVLVVMYRRWKEERLLTQFHRFRGGPTYD